MCRTEQVDRENSRSLFPGLGLRKAEPRWVRAAVVTQRMVEVVEAQLVVEESNLEPGWKVWIAATRR
jgi:hypothetical protein